MLSAFLRATGQLGDPRIVLLLGRAVLLALAVFALLWAGVAWTLAHVAFSSWPWLDRILDLLGGLATLALTWLLFPVVASATIGLFLGAAATAVELRHYPDLPPARGPGFVAGLVSTLRFLAVLLLLNLLLLPCLLLPPVFPCVYYAVNGYLLGREYFELVALRRLPPAAARALRRRHRAGVFAAGLLTAVLLTVPLVNVIVPLLATMAMVHRCEGWRRAG